MCLYILRLVTTGYNLFLPTGKISEIGQIFSAPAIHLNIVCLLYIPLVKNPVHGSSNWEIVFITQKKGEQVFINTFYL